MVGSRYPFRDPPRRPDDQSSGNRLDRPRDQTQGNRRPRTDRPREEGNEIPPAAGAPAPLDLGTIADEVESLVRLMTGTDITELQVEHAGLKIVIRRGPIGAAVPAAAPVVVVPPLPAPAPAEPVAAPAGASPGPPATARPPALPAVPGGHPAAPPLAAGEHLVTSPMVGTFYAAPSPQDLPYVVEGDEVTPGQKIGIVEAMKMMNEIEAEIGGRVTRVLVRDAQGVEYGQPLMVIAES